MKWLFLAGAILSEVSGTTFMKLSRGFERPGFGAAAVACYACTLAMLTLALKRFELGTAYAIWSGCGISLATLLGVLIFRERLDLQKIVGILLVAAGAVVLNAGRSGA
jgi:small multidrug resistance pump